MERRRTGIPLIEALAREVDQLVARAMAEAGGAWTPPVDVVESPQWFHISVDLPGVAPDGVTVSLCDRQLEVAGWKGSRSDEPVPRRFLCVERSSGRFAVTIELPAPVDPARSTARLAAGVLHVSLRRIDDRRHRRHTIPIIAEES